MRRLTAKMITIRLSLEAMQVYTDHRRTHSYLAKFVNIFVIKRIVCKDIFDCSSVLLSMISLYTDCALPHL